MEDNSSSKQQYYNSNDSMLMNLCSLCPCLQKFSLSLSFSRSFTVKKRLCTTKIHMHSTCRYAQCAYYQRHHIHRTTIYGQKEEEEEKKKQRITQEICVESEMAKGKQIKRASDETPANKHTFKSDTTHYQQSGFNMRYHSKQSAHDDCEYSIDFRVDANVKQCKYPVLYERIEKNGLKRFFLLSSLTNKTKCADEHSPNGISISHRDTMCKVGIHSE